MNKEQEKKDHLRLRYKMRNRRYNHPVKRVRTMRSKRSLIDLTVILKKRLMRAKKNLETRTWQREKLRDVNDEVIMKFQEEKTKNADLLAKKIQKETEYVQLLSKYTSCKEEPERLKKHIVDIDRIVSREIVDPLVTLTKGVAALKVHVSTIIQSFRNHDDVRFDTSTSAPRLERHSSPVTLGKDLVGMQNRQAAVQPMVRGYTIHKPTVHLRRVVIPNSSRTPDAPVAVDDSVSMSRRRTDRGGGELFQHLLFPSPILEQSTEETENGTLAGTGRNRDFEDSAGSTDSSDIRDGCIIGNNAAISSTSGMGRPRIKRRMGHIHNFNSTDRQAEASATTEVTIPENSKQTSSRIESFTETKEDKEALKKIGKVETSRRIGSNSDNNTGIIKKDAHSSVSSSSSAGFIPPTEVVTQPENASILPDSFVINDASSSSTHVKPSISCFKAVEDNSKCIKKNRKERKDSRRLGRKFTYDDVVELNRNDLPVNTDTANDAKQPSAGFGDVEPFCGWISSPKEGVHIPDVSVKESTFMHLSASDIEKISEIASTEEQNVSEPSVVTGETSSEPTMATEETSSEPTKATEETSSEPTMATEETSTVHRRLGRKFFPSFPTQMKSSMSRVNTSEGIKEYYAEEQIVSEPTVVTGETSSKLTTTTEETSTVRRRLGRNFSPSFPTQMKSSISRVNNGVTSEEIKEYYAATHSRLEGEPAACSTTVSSTTSGECEIESDVEDGGDIGDVSIVPSIHLVPVEISSATASNRFSESEQLAGEALPLGTTYVIEDVRNRTEHNNIVESVECDMSSKTLTISSDCVVADVDEHPLSTMVTTRKKRKAMSPPVQSSTRHLTKRKNTNTSSELTSFIIARGSSVSTRIKKNSSLKTRRKNTFTSESSEERFSKRQNSKKCGEYSESLDPSFLNGPKDTTSMKSAKYVTPSKITTRKRKASKVSSGTPAKSKSRTKSTKKAKYVTPSRITTRKRKTREVSPETPPRTGSVAKNTESNKKRKKNISDSVTENDTTVDDRCPRSSRPRRAATQGICYAQPSLMTKLRRGSN